MFKFKKCIYIDKYEFPISGKQLCGYYELTMYFDFKSGLRFTASAPNIAYCDRNPMKAISCLIRQLSICNANYIRLQDVVIQQNILRNRISTNIDDETLPIIKVEII